MARDAFDFATVTMAAIGCGLGFFNAWRTWVNDRVRIRVSVSGVVMSNGDEAIAVNVLNLSAFEVTVAHVGFNLIGTDSHLVLPFAFIPGHDGLPIRLKSRAAFAVLHPLPAFKYEHLCALETAYANTACGLTFKSRRSDVAQFNLMAVAGRQTVD